MVFERKLNRIVLLLAVQYSILKSRDAHEGGNMKNMRLLNLFIFGIIASGMSNIACLKDDKMVDAINDSDPEKVRQLIIPGFLIRLEDKKSYAAIAHEKTNETHAAARSFSFSDFWLLGKGAAYLGLGALFAWKTVLKANISFDTFKKPLAKLLAKIGIPIGEPKDEPEQPAAEPASNEEKSSLTKFKTGLLGSLAVYFGYKGLSTFNDVLTHEVRTKAHKNALIIEAMIQRLPAFDNGCFVAGGIEVTEPSAAMAA